MAAATSEPLEPATIVQGFQWEGRKPADRAALRRLEPLEPLEPAFLMMLGGDGVAAAFGCASARASRNGPAESCPPRTETATT
jgi:hypothetical protein